MEPDGKHNIVAVELEQVKKLEGEIAVTDSDILQKRLEQGRLLASLKNNVQGIETGRRGPPNLDFSRKTADNYISFGVVCRSFR